MGPASGSFVVLGMVAVSWSSPVLLPVVVVQQGEEEAWNSKEKG